MFWSYSQVMDIEGVFIDVGCISTHSYTSGGCQIATESTHSFHYKYPSLGPSGRLLDLVAALMRKWQCQGQCQNKTVAVEVRVKV